MLSVFNRLNTVIAYSFTQGRRRRSGRAASAGPLFWPTMLSAVSFFLDSVHFTFYSGFIQSAKIY